MHGFCKNWKSIVNHTAFTDQVKWIQLSSACFNHPPLHVFLSLLFCVTAWNDLKAVLYYTHCHFLPQSNLHLCMGTPTLPMMQAAVILISINQTSHSLTSYFAQALSSNRFNTVTFFDMLVEFSYSVRTVVLQYTFLQGRQRLTSPKLKCFLSSSLPFLRFHPLVGLLRFYALLHAFKKAPSVDDVWLLMPIDIYLLFFCCSHWSAIVLTLYDWTDAFLVSKFSVIPEFI